MRLRSAFLVVLLALANAQYVSAQSGPVNTKALVENNATLAAWNSATSLNATQTIFSTGDAGFNAVVVYLTQTTTLTAGAVTFEGSYDNATWVAVSADAVLDPTSTTYAQIAIPYTVQASTNKAFLIINKGWIGLRIKLSTQITGTGAVTPSAAFVPYPTALSVEALSPTAANFNVTALATLQTQTDTVMVGGVNIKEINGVATSMNAGSPDTGTQRVVNADGVLDCAIVSAASTNATNCKNSAGTLVGYELFNTTTTVYYIRTYNLTTAPTCSSATGWIRSIPIPPAGAAGQVGGAILPVGPGVAYGTGLGYCITGGSASTDNTNAAIGVFGVLKYR